jgi:hypothetical protein
LNVISHNSNFKGHQYLNLVGLNPEVSQMISTFTRRRNLPLIHETQPITWNSLCHFCGQPVQSGNPFLILNIEHPTVVGVAHAICSYNDYRYAQFHLCPPDYLTGSQIAFLVQFYPRLFSLPGWGKTNAELRRCLATLLLNYPHSLLDPLAALRQARGNCPDSSQPYLGDLESDYLRFLGQVHQAAQEQPLKLEVDFRQKIAVSVG